MEKCLKLCAPTYKMIRLKKYILPGLWILKISKRSKYDFLFIILLSVISSGIEILCLTVLREFLSISSSTLISESAIKSLRYVSMQIVLAYSARFFVVSYINYCIFNYASSVLDDLRNYLIQLSFINKSSTPQDLDSTATINTIQNSSINSVNVYVIALAKALTETFVALVIVIYLLYSDFSFTSFSITSLAVTGAILYGPIKRIYLKYGNRSLRANEKTLEILTDTQSSIATLKSYGSLPYFIDYFMKYAHVFKS